jgi:ketosteroid isomerase-like protein
VDIDPVQEERIMTDQEARDLVTNVLSKLLDPALPAEAVTAHFAPEYEQIVDGKRLDRSAFVEHIRALKSVLSGGEASIEAVVAGPGTIATRHLVTARKRSGEVVRMEVHAFFEVNGGLITRTRELTHMVEGTSADRDLGART